MSEKKNQSMQFSINIKNLIRACLADPDLKEQVHAAIREGAATKTTEQLGYWNMSGKDVPAAEQVWCTLFAATDRNKKVGEKGLFYTAQKSGFPLFRFKEQVKNMAATTGETTAATVSEPAPLPAPTRQPSIEEIAAALGMTREQLIEQAAAASYKPEMASDEEPTVNTEAAPAEAQLPDDIAAIVGL